MGAVGATHGATSSSATRSEAGIKLAKINDRTETRKMRTEGIIIQKKKQNKTKNERENENFSILI